MHVLQYSAIHYALIMIDLCATWHVGSQVQAELLLDVAATIYWSMLASNVNRCNNLTVPGPVMRSVLHPLHK